MLQHLESLPIGTLAHTDTDTHTNTQTQHRTQRTRTREREREGECRVCVLRRRDNDDVCHAQMQTANWTQTSAKKLQEAKLSSSLARVGFQASVDVDVDFDVATPKWRDRLPLPPSPNQAYCERAGKRMRNGSESERQTAWASLSAFCCCCCCCCSGSAYSQFTFISTGSTAMTRDASHSGRNFDWFGIGD